MRSRKEMLTSEELHHLFEYNPETGSLAWKVSRRAGIRTIKAGTPIGKDIAIEGMRYTARRTIWCMVHGEWPKEDLFWLNGNSKDRRLKNIGIVPSIPDDGILTQEYLKKVLHYEPETGNFFHKVTQGHSICGRLAGCTSRGYRKIRVLDRLYQAHRLDWFYMYGQWPDGELDHNHGNRGDNKVAKLRSATYSQNRANSNHWKYGNTSIRGIHKCKNGKYQARCNSKYLGTFKTLDEAIVARLDAEKRYQGEYAYSRRVEQPIQGFSV